MSNAWAKCPSAWARVKREDALELPADEQMEESSPLGLGFIGWRAHGSTGTAAILVLFALAICANLANRGKAVHALNPVRATYTELGNMTGLSRVVISRALRLLEELGAIATERVGNASVYTLLGVDTDGKWCAIPQGRLMDGKDYLARLKGIQEFIRRPASLFAMKLYMLLLVFRDRRANVTRISYESITKYTGLRRENISVGWQTLVALRLAYLADDSEVPRRAGDHPYNQYRLYGLNVQ